MFVSMFVSRERRGTTGEIKHEKREQFYANRVNCKLGKVIEAMARDQHDQWCGAQELRNIYQKI